MYTLPVLVLLLTVWLQAWQVGSDDYVTPEPVRYARKITDNGPVSDFTGKDITYAFT